MTHNFKTGVTYKTRGGSRAWFIGVASGLTWPYVFKHEDFSVVTQHDEEGNLMPEGTYSEDDCDIIGTWEESPEEIDVANMWVAIVRHKKNGSIMANRRMYADKPANLPADTIAFIRVSEWEAIKRGERKLIKGEGL